MSILFDAVLPLPPSVNRRVLITRYGGREHPSVTAYKWLCKEPLRTAYRDEQAILQARHGHAWLKVAMRFLLPVERDKQGRIQFEIRDLDNMVQVPLNILKIELGIDDARVVDLLSCKRPLSPGAEASLRVVVEDLEDFYADAHHNIRSHHCA
jgi:Holliday junction resolvase RusA-like endonuclease